MNAARPVLSVLDLVPTSDGRSRADALREMLDLARAADEAGYARYWLAEHHGSITYLASATTVLMGQVLAATSRIGVASGGIMLPNHAPWPLPSRSALSPPFTRAGWDWGWGAHRAPTP